jgi:hypothetical protein
MYGIFGRKITEYTVIYGVYIWFWPTLCMAKVQTMYGECTCIIFLVNVQNVYSIIAAVIRQGRCPGGFVDQLKSRQSVQITVYTSHLCG